MKEHRPANRDAGKEPQDPGMESGPLRVRDARIQRELDQTLEERRLFIRSFDWGASTEWELRREDFVRGLQDFEERFRSLVLRDRQRQDTSATRGKAPKDETQGEGRPG